MRNKRATSDRLLSIWWFVILAIVGGGVVAGVFMFYSADVNVKKIDAEILYNRLAGCVVEHGYLVEGFGADTNVFEFCHLNSTVLEGGRYYFEIVLDGDGGFKILGGTAMLKEDSNIEKTVSAKNFPRGYSQVEKVLTSSLDMRNLKILAVSNMEGGAIVDEN